MADWEPATDEEAALRDALRAGDQELYFRILARIDLLLPVSDPAPGGRTAAGWGTWTTGGRTHVLAFTSAESMRASLTNHTGPARRVPYHDLATAWPNQDWWLAINPGLPIEGYLPAWFVAQLARGDVRLPGRTLGARARVEAATRHRPTAPPLRDPNDPGAPIGLPPRQGAGQPGAGAEGRLTPSAPPSPSAPPTSFAQPAPPDSFAPPGSLASFAPPASSASFAPPASSASFAPPASSASFAQPGSLAPPAAESNPPTPRFQARAAQSIQGRRSVGLPNRPMPPGARESGLSRRPVPPPPGEGGPPGRPVAPAMGEGGLPSRPVPLATTEGGLPIRPVAPATTEGGLPGRPVAPAMGEGGLPRRPVSPASSEGGLPDATPSAGGWPSASRAGELARPRPAPWGLDEAAGARAEPPAAARTVPAPYPAPPPLPVPPSPTPPSPARAQPPAAGAAWPAVGAVRAPMPRPAESSARPPVEQAGRARVPAHAAPPEPAEAPAREPDFVAANEVEANLLAAASDGQTDTFLSTLLLARVLVPVPDGASRVIAPGQPDFVWRREQVDGQPYVVVFTSTDRLEEYLGSGVDAITVKFVQLIRAWPEESWSFAVNPGTPVGATLPGAQIRALAAWAAEVGLSDDPSVQFDKAPSAVTSRPDSTQAVMMQKPIAPTQVAYFLDRGYDRISGFVHRASEAAHLTTPEQLYAALGLGYPGSPFKPSDDEVYVLRWTAYRPNLYRIPYGGRDEASMRAMQGWVMERSPFRGNGFAPSESSDVIAEFKVDSARLPHGAQMWRVSRDSGETLVALLDSDVPRWRRVGSDLEVSGDPGSPEAVGPEPAGDTGGGDGAPDAADGVDDAEHEAGS